MIHVECNSVRELPTIPEQPLFRIMNEDLETSHQDPTMYGLFPEYYVMEVWDLKNRSIRRNLSAETPNFMLKGLLPGSWLRLILYAVNSHGKSDAVIIETVVAGDAEKQTLVTSERAVETAVGGGQLGYFFLASHAKR
ncbi:unnamed protein product [Allacma fusca]|uniref:Uncharacterized protein n=1 Tax=Allacma fusca TaxID=39272 RepID=A0A8J2PNR0_9HEXA|nr:unnamed protein product [Allacma fusca]